MAEAEEVDLKVAYGEGGDVEMQEVKSQNYRLVDGTTYIIGREDYDYTPEVSLNGLKKFWSSICRVEIGPVHEMTAEDMKEWGVLAGFMAFIDNSFRLTDRKTTVWTEFIGGMTVFFSIAYVLVANPHILHATGIPTNGVFFSTALASGVMTSVMGVVTNLPIVVGPSLGLNVYFRQIARACPTNPENTLDGPWCETWGETTLPWSDALGAVYISGWLYLAATVTGFRGYLYQAFPRSMRSAIAVGSGFFLCYYGLQIGSVTRVSIDKNYLTTMFTDADCSADGSSCQNIDLGQRWYNMGIAHFPEDPAARIAMLGVAFLSALELFKIKGSYIIAIWFCTLIGISYYHCRSTRHYADDLPANERCVTDLHLWSGEPNEIPFLVNWAHNPAGKLTFKYANTNFFWQVVWTMLYFEIFDSYGAIENVVARVGLTHNYPTVAVDRVNRAMFVDGFSVWLGSIMGCNSLNAYIESATGVEAGARTGLAAVFCGFALLLCLFFLNPLVSIIPPCATTCVLVMVGVNSMLEYKRIDWNDWIIRMTSFFIISTMAFTFSITNGISVGVIFYGWVQILAWVLQKVGINVETIRPGTKVSFPHPFLILCAVFAACRFSYFEKL
jgi:AGZA family xanthine/uracil permease-like MFS transporter